MDTLESVIRIIGNQSFPIESDADPDSFPALCAEFAKHVENGAAIPAFDIPQSDGGHREWARVRRFLADRRHAEKSFVKERLDGYRGVVEDLVSGLREIGKRDQGTEEIVRDGLTTIEEAVKTGQLPQIQAALTRTITGVTDTFAQQKLDYENQLKELNHRMSSLRQDLVAAREEMKRDALTDAFNRGAFDAAIEQTLNMHFVLQQPAVLIMIDLDHFKQINDSCGHIAGDAALRAVSDCLARSFSRRSDFVARYGGDEFAVILPDTLPETCHALVERFLHNVRDIRLPSAPDEALITCSVGYTDTAIEDSVESLMKRADQALYAAKAAGRDGSAFRPAALAGIRPPVEQ